MKQYYAIKAKYPGAILLFRVGDFYETFGEDAIKVAGILNITLTKRGNGSASEIELAGFPHHALDNYLPKLVRAGQRVAVCDQLEDPSQAVGIVKRGVTELVTPGVVLDNSLLDTRRNNFLAAVHHQSPSMQGLALLDISTGEFMLAEGSPDYIGKLLQSFTPAEVLYCKAKKADFEGFYGDNWHSYALEDWVFQHDYAEEKLNNHFGTLTLKGFGVAELRSGIVAAGTILYYLEITEHRQIAHIHQIKRLEADRYVWMDRFTLRNLELVTPQQDGGIALIEILDQTLTPMGARMLRHWVVLPLKEVRDIKLRLEGVKMLLEHQAWLGEIRHLLKPIGDLERLTARLSTRRAGPREMLALHRALCQIPLLEDLLDRMQAPMLRHISDRLQACDKLKSEISRTLQDQVPALAQHGNLIREGVDAELDQLRQIAFSGKDYLLQITQREIERTGISSLKISYNKVFGYYLEVTNTHKDKVPADWIRKQTLANAERYITEELKTYEESILTAESKLLQIEIRIFEELVTIAQDYVSALLENSRLLAELDCLAGFAVLADQNGYQCPELLEESVLDIKAGRHPVIEKQLPLGEAYVPNDIRLDQESQQIIIITGPNMAGKSALLRQTALIVLMAQIGSFVPAQAAQVGVVDKIFTRVGASDNLSRGESTFMVEMTETASILNNLSDKSLIIMDEIGRGTSTYDGVSIAWSIVEYLHNHPKCKARTLFATHYHELNELAADLPRVKNYNVSVKQVGGKVVFLRKLQAGGSAHSFGIHVAQIAGMPNAVVLRSHEIMKHLEKEHAKPSANSTKSKVKDIPKVNYQLNFFESIQPELLEAQSMIKALDINGISPVEALLKLNELKTLLEKAQQ